MVLDGAGQEWGCPSGKGGPREDLEIASGVWKVGGFWKGLREVRNCLDAADPNCPNWRAAQPNKQRLKVGSGHGMGWDGMMRIWSDTTVSQNKLSNTMGSIRKKEFFACVTTQKDVSFSCMW